MNGVAMHGHAAGTFRERDEKPEGVRHG